MDFYGSPTYSVKYYRDNLYKLVRFNSPRGCCIRSHDDRGEQSYEKKLASSLSRARSVVYQLAICNDWQYFFTGTLSPELHDRNNLFAFQNRFTQWIRDLRKKLGYEDLAYLLIPERHKDGAWHMHGLISGLPESALSDFIPGMHPQTLIDKGYKNWGAYSAKFGFCSLDVVRDPEAAATYLTKYLTKDIQSSVTDVGGHTYYCSRGLCRAVRFGDIYGSYLALDCLLESHNQYCSCGMVRDVPWHFWLNYIDLSGIEFIPSDSDAVELVPDQVWEQTFIAGFPIGKGRSPYEEKT